MHIAICDDEKNDLDALETAIKKYDTSGKLQLSRFLSAKVLYEYATKYPFDIAILDIEMNAPNGFDIALKLIEIEHKPLIVFLTKSMAYTVRGYGVAFRYLPKPISTIQLHATLDAAIREIKSNRYYFSIDGLSYILRFDEIFFLEVYNHNVILHTQDHNYTFRAALKDVLSSLPKGYFGTPHQSYVVNLSHIQTATVNEIILTNGSSIPISRRRQKDFQNQLHSYLGR